MATTSRRAARRPRRPTSVAKPSGSIHPRVQKVGPEHFGIVAVDCAKARSKWMLTDFYGNILIDPPPSSIPARGSTTSSARIRRAMADHDLRDLIVAIERTGNYHLPVQRAVAAAGLRGPHRPSPGLQAIPPARPTPATRPTTPTSPPSSAPPSTASA